MVAIVITDISYKHTLLEQILTAGNIVRPGACLLPPCNIGLKMRSSKKYVARFTNFQWRMSKDNFKKLGYSIAGHKLHAAMFGIPQKRKRVVIVGTLKGNPELLFPRTIISNEQSYITTKEAIGDLLNIHALEKENIIKLKTKPSNPFQRFIRGFISPREYFEAFS